MPEPEISEWVYQASDGREAKIIAPFGLIAPPTLALHQPSVGPVTFYYRESHTVTPEESK